jgi:hypothetical protein
MVLIRYLEDTLLRTQHQQAQEAAPMTQQQLVAHAMLTTAKYTA